MPQAEDRSALSRLIYVADPMCSWCYGFGPELAALLRQEPGLPLELVMGGLRAYNTQVLDDDLRATLRSHWQKVGDISGLPFCDDALRQPGFIYDTEPACRAVVAARRLAPDAALTAFTAIQQAFYAEGKDTTQGTVLAEVAAAALNKQTGTRNNPMTPADFLQEWASPSTQEATRADFVQAQQWGITGFPTVLLQQGNQLRLVSSGFIRAEPLRERLAAVRASFNMNDKAGQ